VSCDDFVELREPFEPQDDHERFIKLGALLGAAETRRFMKGEVQSEKGRERVELKSRRLFTNLRRGCVRVKHLQERLLWVQSGGNKSFGPDGFPTSQFNPRDSPTTKQNPFGLEPG